MFAELTHLKPVVQKIDGLQADLDYWLSQEQLDVQSILDERAL